MLSALPVPSLPCRRCRRRRGFRQWSRRTANLSYHLSTSWFQRSKEIGLETMQVAKVYRQLLKAVEKHIGKDGGKRYFQDYIIEEFRKNANLSDQAAVQNKVKLAHDYTFLLNSVHHHKELLFSYNIAVDRSDEMKKILDKSAASVGLQLPDDYQP